MRALIVDDEQHVREGIKLLGQWDDQGIKEIFEAENGEEAVDLIKKYKPAIIFTDMKMPKMDGIQLLEWIKNNQSGSKTIVVTGYDDYHYMRKAIHFGSADYILKPIDPEILNDTLANAVAEWKKEEASRKKDKSIHQLMNEMKPVYRDRKLTQLLNSQKIDQSIYEEMGLHITQNYEVAIIRINDRTIDPFKGDRDLAYFTILNVINEVLSEKKCGIGFRYLSNKGEIVIIFWDQLEQADQLLQQIYLSLIKSLKVSCPMGLGKIVGQVSNLMESYKHAKELLLSSNVLAKTELRVYTEEVEKPMLLTNLMDYSSQIEQAIQTGEIRVFEEIIQNLLKEFQESRTLSLRQLLHFEKEYQVMSHRWLKKYEVPYFVTDHVEKQIDLFFDQQGTFQLEQYTNRKKREIALFLKIVKRHSPQKNKNVIAEIEQYLQANFNRDVKLQEIADRFYLSREYISRKFKQEFNENISDYLVKIRMNKAKSLLKNSQLKIYEIANMIGYQDDKYFRKVFKKIEGITPNEYRGLHL
ncbi:response regulator [Priestia abyssalis]|uniref:response regulator n=1 Tax=Priestia abyssalis TaxID=1221450 RepID=UPI00099517E2|nr:response regulator [Priestia abyssalis]